MSNPCLTLLYVQLSDVNRRRQRKRVALTFSTKTRSRTLYVQAIQPRLSGSPVQPNWHFCNFVEKELDIFCYFWKYCTWCFVNILFIEMRYLWYKLTVLSVKYFDCSFFIRNIGLIRIFGQPDTVSVSRIYTRKETSICNAVVEA